MAPRAKSPRSTKSPGRPRKTNVSSIEKTLERPSESVIMGFEGVAFLFLLGGVAAAVAWMVYVAKFNLDLYRKIDTSLTDATVDGQIVERKFSLKNLLTIEQFTICFQGVVASLLLYFAFKHHFSHEM
jgi:hypothetical protein